MKVILDGFSYYYSSTVGGLFSTSWKFAPEDLQHTDVETVKSGLKSIASAHQDIAERLFSEVVKGKREPVLEDNPLETCFGYKYRGRLSMTRKLFLVRRLQNIFSRNMITLKNWKSATSTLHSYSMKIACKLPHPDHPHQKPHLDVEHSMGHYMNICLFRHILALDDLKISQQAEPDIEKLRQLIDNLERLDGEPDLTLLDQP